MQNQNLDLKYCVFAWKLANVLLPPLFSSMCYIENILFYQFQIHIEKHTSFLHILVYFYHQNQGEKKMTSKIQQNFELSTNQLTQPICSSEDWLCWLAGNITKTKSFFLRAFSHESRPEYKTYYMFFHEAIRIYITQCGKRP